MCTSRFILAVAACLTLSSDCSTALSAERPNVLLITLDDMSADSVGVYGCPVADTTPAMDALARRGFRFTRAHVQVGNCMPGRNVMWSGLYPHHNRVEGFYQVADARHTHLVDLMNAAGYFTAIRGKVQHSTPYTPYAWDLVLDNAQQAGGVHPKDAASYGTSTHRAIAAAGDAGQPFCLMVNVSDPHKPFYAQDRQGTTIPDPHVPSRVFAPAEVVIPGFLFEDTVVRKEVAHYYSSVRRADDCVAEVIKALDDSGQAERTLIMLLSDHGMALPFAKTQVYHHSTHTPLMFVWPGVTTPGGVDDHNMVSAVDLLPTLADLVGVAVPAGLDGRSFAPLIATGLADPSAAVPRDHVIKQYNENAGGSRDPMRAIQTRQHLYIFNPWSDGQRVMKTATTGTPTYRRMAELAKTDPRIAARHDLYQFRVLEELYDVAADPDCLVNLIAEPEMRATLNELRATLLSELQRVGDPVAELLKNRDNAPLRQQYVEAEQRRSDQRRQNQQRQQNQRRPNQRRQNRL